MTHLKIREMPIFNKNDSPTVIPLNLRLNRHRCQNYVTKVNSDPDKALDILAMTEDVFEHKILGIYTPASR